MENNKNRTIVWIQSFYSVHFSKIFFFFTRSIDKYSNILFSANTHASAYTLKNGQTITNLQLNQSQSSNHCILFCIKRNKYLNISMTRKWRREKIYELQYEYTIFLRWTSNTCTILGCALCTVHIHFYIRKTLP